jgi:hypothetical protein
MTLDLVQGGTELLTNADFDVSDPNGSNFLYTVGNVTGGQFEVFNGEKWVAAETGGFTTTQIEAGHVEFVQDGSLIAPYFSISAADTATNTVSTSIAPTVSFTAEVAGGGKLEFSSAIAPDQAVAFQGSTGSLTLDHPTNFTGVISGFAGDGTLSGSDQIDLKGIDYNSRSFTKSYDVTHDTLTVSDGTNSAVLHFNGTYQATNFSFTTDGDGGTIVYDPPVTDHSAAKAQAVTPTNHSFVFNFVDNGHDAANANHPAADTRWSDGPLFANAEAILNKLHDDSHGNAAAPPDSHEALTAAGIKAQWHAHDFHFV